MALLINDMEKGNDEDSSIVLESGERNKRRQKA